MWKSIKSFFFSFVRCKNWDIFPVYVHHKNIAKGFPMLHPAGMFLFLVWILNKHGMGN